ncbi:N-acetylmuramoyl-L-alanine amidase [Oscillatoria sp. FACHB-1406]|uniref:N-acetylmuramoyl-L-alanine amidase n=1 Tax=Oscillatoria sp. FACHB-1406 TaxID=2692846 RepID=UPI0016895840|nr:N-acetylmuramoyl-L-alanine amidase [Oscillatoria sp. FACHB-1406]MBD2576742.1 N-acetylmuramoyl-L-alanine amidase [Oscillatoria sp. FACHB-1406]
MGKFGIDMGHNAPPDTGAVGIAKEDNLTLAVGTRVIAKLTSLGHIAINCTPKWASSVVDSLDKRCQVANANRVDYYVSIHFNSFNRSANGTEVFAISSGARRIAQPVLDNIVRLGFYNRGVKDGSHLYVLKNSNMPAILIECCFIDSQRDMALFDAEKMANAIVRGLTGQDPTASSGSSGGTSSGNVTPPPPPAPPAPKADPQVLKLQKALNRLQVKDSNGKALVEDGTIDAATESATSKFHSAMAISLPGRAGAETWKAIDEIFLKPILRPNHATGKAVRYVQFRLGTSIDGVYGDMTARAVSQFQSRYNLTADGIIGSQSWSKLIG